MKKLSGLLMAVGVMVIVGTAGASDMGNISLWESLLQVMGGFGILLVGYGGWRLSGRRLAGKKPVRQIRAVQPTGAAVGDRTTGLSAPAVSVSPAALAPHPSGSPTPRRIA